MEDKEKEPCRDRVQKPHITGGIYAENVTIEVIENTFGALVWIDFKKMIKAMAYFLKILFVGA